MDPNACLNELRRLAADVPNMNSENAEELAQALETFQDHFEALDQWLTRGGFLPLAWCEMKGLKHESPQR